MLLLNVSMQNEIEKTIVESPKLNKIGGKINKGMNRKNGYKGIFSL
jgi:hypothetical protein